jgi:crotonobetainyl-CoA:carnitine CoA-transferase CaiB-like acyl-CoA transferase
MSQANTVLPLDGVKVLDFTTLLPGPMAALVLAEAGADVLKIERPGVGEEMRKYLPKWGREPVSFALLNRGKKSLAIDLKDRRTLKLIEPLIEEADVLIEQFRPGVMERLGLSYESVAKINPKLIYCSITGYGSTGPKSDVAGHDLNYIGDTGLLSLSMGPAETPVVPPALIADLAGGTYPAVVNILLALLQRDKTGQGSHLDIAMTDNMFMLMVWAIGNGLITKHWPESGGELLTGGTARYQIYPAKDGRFVAAAPIEQKFWERFCELIELPEELRDDRKDPAATLAKARTIIASRASGEWRRIFYREDCCCSIVQTLQEALTDEHFLERGLFDYVLENEDGDTIPATAVCVVPQFRDSPTKPKSAPALGAHNDEVLKKLNV